ncbi:MAG: SDR family oxidoreductase [Candidatus Altiarchaeota archaeon]|nr:SDR family oxidoreductase [Candidatus Altiarchaeota archaeon]
MENVALITGASSGIGAEFAKIHAQKGGDLILVARRKDKLKELKTKLEENGSKVIIIAADLSKNKTADEIYKYVSSKKIKIKYLINNAGFGNLGLFYEGNLETYENMIAVNITALTKLTRLFLPDMIKLDEGKIMLVSSIASFVPGPLNAVYSATKAYVTSFGESLANEVKETGVSVTTLCPGATKTEFGKVSGFEQNDDGPMQFAPAKEVAEYGYDAMLNDKGVVVPGMFNKFITGFVSKFVPRSMTAKFARSMMDKRDDEVIK